MEDKISLPLPDDATQQALIGMNATANGMEYFTMSSSGTEGSYHTFYYRHTIADDGSISTTPEKWLEDCAPQSGNQLSLVRAADGICFQIEKSELATMMKTARHKTIFSSAETTGRRALN